MPQTLTRPKPRLKPPAKTWDTVADMLHDLGDIDPSRVRFRPFPCSPTGRPAPRQEEEKKK